MAQDCPFPGGKEYNYINSISPEFLYPIWTLCVLTAHVSNLSRWSFLTNHTPSPALSVLPWPCFFLFYAMSLGNEENFNVAAYFKLCISCRILLMEPEDGPLQKYYHRLPSRPTIWPYRKNTHGKILLLLFLTCFLLG